MAHHYARALRPSDLAGRTVKLKFNSTRDSPIFLELRVSDGHLGEGAEALVYTVTSSGRWRASDYKALGLAPDRPLAARFSTRETAVITRRTSALLSIIEIQRRKPDEMFGLVDIFGYGVVVQVDGRAVEDVTIYFDLMAFAGSSLVDMVAVEGVGGPGRRWTLSPGQTAAAFVPAAKALAVLHEIRETTDGRTVATAHRDIKPGNLLVLWPEKAAYTKAIAGLSPTVIPKHNLPLVQIGDLGDVRSLGTARGATGTSTTPNSGRWSSPESQLGAAPNAAAADVWSFGATLFFAATGHYPWTKLAFDVDFDLFRLHTITSAEAPDARQFISLPPRMSGLIRECLRHDPNDRPSMAVVAIELEDLVAAERVFAAADTPTHEVPVPLRPVPVNPNPSRPARASPAARPAAPSASPAARPAAPSSRPAARPAAPSSRPAARPAAPSSRPAARPAAPSSRPAARPAAPSSRPAARPPASVRPAARPARPPEPLSGLQTAGVLGSVVAFVMVLFLLLGFHVIPSKDFPIDLRQPPSEYTSGQTGAPVNDPAVTTAASPDPSTSTPTPDPIFDSGPWTHPQAEAALAEPRSDLGWAFSWAIRAASDGGDRTNAAFVFNDVIGSESLLKRPSFIFELSEIRNYSSKSLTFDLNNCELTEGMDQISKTLSGPSLLVSGASAGIGGFSLKDGTGPTTALPSCRNPGAKWAGPITVGAGSTWNASNKGDYIMVFEMQPDSTAETHKPTGFLLKSTSGDVAFADFGGNWELRFPQPYSCIC